MNFVKIIDAIIKISNNGVEIEKELMRRELIEKERKEKLRKELESKRKRLIYLDSKNKGYGKNIIIYLILAILAIFYICMVIYFFKNSKEEEDKLFKILNVLFTLCMFIITCSFSQFSYVGGKYADCIKEMYEICEFIMINDELSDEEEKIYNRITTKSSRSLLSKK